MKAFLALEDGTVFEGTSIGAEGEVIGEIVFNTAMTGYQEALTDPSYYGQIMTMTFPLIGNYGVNEEDQESDKVQVRGFVVRELCRQPANWRMTGTLEDYLKRYNIVAVEGIDTRKLTKIIREKGAMNGVISTRGDFAPERYADAVKNYRIVDAVKSVTCPAPYELKSESGKYKVALYDLGAKRNIARSLVKRGCDVTVLPAFTPAREVLGGGFDGVMLSNGPGDPKECADVIAAIKTLQQAKIPIFGICLGHQLTALANGMDTEKMKYGHRGSNHPVTHLSRGRTFITSQNHGYVVVGGGAEHAEITHYNLNDHTVEGMRYKDAPVFTVQFHPEASQGPLDTEYLFDDFIQLMEVRKNA
ncbi:MAG: carbamoyl phosphate synthase small subunit [Clostridiales bacterium]|jgi:carbamoyl-phosphate synthase small subunit|nr:carbamoyl phosphate synthase small subunit [Clostridiales bacterium]